MFGVVTKPALGDGAFGEYVTAPEAYTARVPAGLDLAVAGAPATAWNWRTCQCPAAASPPPWACRVTSLTGAPSRPRRSRRCPPAGPSNGSPLTWCKASSPSRCSAPTRWPTSPWPLLISPWGPAGSWPSACHERGPASSSHCYHHDDGPVHDSAQTSQMASANVQSRYGYPGRGLAPQDGGKTRPRRDH